jgi:putative endonuclease
LSGKLAELFSILLLIAKGYSILESNYRKKWGELDIVAKKGNVLVFVEVKFRKTERFGFAEQFVDNNKQRKLIKTAKAYMFEKGINPENTVYRFDVIGITGLKVNHIKNAF